MKEREWDGRCQRCGKPSISHTMSFFNTSLICNTCDEKERERDDFEDARNADEDAIRQGNHNFPGIGFPKA